VPHPPRFPQPPGQASEGSKTKRADGGLSALLSRARSVAEFEGDFREPHQELVHQIRPQEPPVEVPAGDQCIASGLLSGCLSRGSLGSTPSPRSSETPGST